MDIEQGKSELTYTLNVLSNHTVKFTFVEGEATDGGGSNTGLIISIVVIILVLAGGRRAVLPQMAAVAVLMRETAERNKK